jgi:8-oxo-dGDP phosphatase
VIPTAPGDPESDGFSRGSEEELYSGRVIRLVHATFADPDGDRFERSIVRHPGAVSIVAIDTDGRATLVRQLRAAVWQLLLELPAGTCDVEGEPPLETARRELAEEAGLEAEHWRPLASVLNSPGYSDQQTVIFLATGLRQCPTARAGSEERWMTTHSVALADVEDLMADGTLRDETTILGLLLARRALAGGA